MPKVQFMPSGVTVDVDQNVKILVAARRAKVPIRYGCASCRCGTCGIAVRVQDGTLNAIAEDEKIMLQRLGLNVNGEHRMACRARVMAGTVQVDLDFQDTYEPPESL